MAILEISDLHVKYGNIEVLHGINLRVEEGEIVTILGANGAGKSTTLLTLSGLVRAAAGGIEFSGVPIHRLPAHNIVKLGIAQVPEGRRIFNTLTVQENLNLGAFVAKDKALVKSTQDWIYTLLPILSERREQLGGTLSGGEQQMLAIGRALMSRPKLLMLDEPSLGLSPLLTKEIFSIIQNINQKGVTIFLVEQNVNMALKYSHYAFLMENGRIVRADRPEILREDDDVKEFYLGIATETSVKGYKRYRRKVRFR